jgi:hypothetical protein
LESDRFALKYFICENAWLTAAWHFNSIAVSSTGQSKVVFSFETSGISFVLISLDSKDMFSAIFGRADTTSKLGSSRGGSQFSHRKFLQLLVNKTLYEKTLASGFGVIHFIVDASEDQQFKEAALAYGLLLKADTWQV